MKKILFTLSLLTPTLAMAIGLPHAHDVDAYLEHQSRVVQAKYKAPNISSPATTNFNEVAKECGTGVHHSTLQAIVRTESAFNPYAIGVVGGSIKQPTNLADAVAAAYKLHSEGKNFSLGLAQINRHNLDKYGLNYETVFEPCANLKAGAEILAECYGRANGSSQEALQKALSCYYSGNFRTGFTQDFAGQPSYVEKVKNAARNNTDHATIKVAQEAVPPPKTELIPALDPKVTVGTPARAKARVKTQTVAQESSVIAKTVTSTQATRASWDAFGDW